MSGVELKDHNLMNEKKISTNTMPMFKKRHAHFNIKIKSFFARSLTKNNTAAPLFTNKINSQK